MHVPERRTEAHEQAEADQQAPPDEQGAMGLCERPDSMAVWETHWGSSSIKSLTQFVRPETPETRPPRVPGDSA
jgi:hypothetical protein